MLESAWETDLHTNFVLRKQVYQRVPADKNRFPLGDVITHPIINYYFQGVWRKTIHNTIISNNVGYICRVRF